MGLRTRIKQKGKRVAKRVIRRFQGDPTEHSASAETTQETSTEIDDDVQRLAQELEETDVHVSTTPPESVAFQVDLPELEEDLPVAEVAPVEEGTLEESGPAVGEEPDTQDEARNWPPLLEGDTADTIRNDVIEQIQTIFDPEIPVNIYELGLIYEVHVHENMAVNVIMTLTSPNCPAAQSLPNEVKVKTEDLEAVTEAAVDVVWEPVWGPHLMTEAARLELNL